MSIGFTPKEVQDNLLRVYLNYGNSADKPSLLKRTGIHIWNAIKHVFGQSDWQVARKKIAFFILIDGSKNSTSFSSIVFPGLREDVFNASEVNEIANNILNLLIKKSHHDFNTAVRKVHRRLDRCAGEVLFRKASKNPKMFPELDFTGETYQKKTYKEQLRHIFTCSRSLDGGFCKLESILDTDG